MWVRTKGTTCGSFSSGTTRRGAPSGDEWLRALLKNNVTAQPCGACGACGHRVRRHSGRVRVATAIAVRAEPQNAKVLRRLFRAFGLAERGAEVVHAAVGDGMGGGMASVAVSKEVGDERGGIVDGGKRATVGVKATTIDELVRRYQLRVVCLIDAEGHDHAILRGAEASIKQNRLRVIAFEYGDQWCRPGLGGGCVPAPTDDRLPCGPRLPVLVAGKWWPRCPRVCTLPRYFYSAVVQHCVRERKRLSDRNGILGSF